MTQYIKIENGTEIYYRQPLHIENKYVFTTDPSILAENGYLPLITTDYPEMQEGYYTNRTIVLNCDHYEEKYELVTLHSAKDRVPS